MGSNIPFSLLFIYMVPIFFALVFYQRRTKKKESHSRVRLKESLQAGLTEPPSLHPVIDPNVCIGCGSCVKACPEKALGLVNGKAVLVEPAHCIGHGACQIACPVEGIQLVFGTEKRGMDIPQVDPTFETNVPGIFIAGELGGMGLIRKAVEQGKQAMETISKKRRGSLDLDVLIVGAGPAGLSASLAAMQDGLRAVTIEQEDSFGGTVYHFPRNKIAMTAPVNLPMIGKVKMYEISKEQLLEFWKGVIENTGLQIRLHERLETITSIAGGFVVTTSKATYKTSNVLLAMGRRGTPRKLGIPGEEQSKVVYRLIDAEQYRGQHVLVVGGGDSAVEAALALSDEQGTTVTLSYRSQAFSRLKPKNRQRLHEASQQQKLQVLLQSKVVGIGQKDVVIDYQGKSLQLQNDAVIVCAGGILPTPFLKEIGVMVETHHGTVRV